MRVMQKLPFMLINVPFFAVCGAFAVQNIGKGNYGLLAVNLIGCLFSIGGIIAILFDGVLWGKSK